MRDATPNRGNDRDSGELGKLKKRGVIDPAGATCSLCQQEAGDCRPTPITVMQWVPSTCNDCYRWLKDRDLFDEQRDKDLFYPDEMLIADGGQPSDGTGRAQIYLAGQIRKAADPVSWRADIRQSTAEFDFADPVRRDVDPDGPADEIVEGDLELIRESDGLLVGWHDDIPAVGTPMEIIHAVGNDIPVVVWRRDDGDEPLSPWMRYYADAICEQRDAALWQLHGLVLGVSRDD